MMKKKQTPSTKKTSAKKDSSSSKKKTAPQAASKKKAVPASRKKVGSTKKTKRPSGQSYDFPIVGIGASAGGLEALESFFKAMPADAGVALVLVVHLDPTHISILPELLQKHTKMPVAQIEDGTKVQPNHVYVIPPNKDLTILHGTLHLMELGQPRSTNLPIDTFFRSLAQDQGRNAACIVLSGTGTGTDGTLGVKTIKGEVGMAMVQDEESSKYEGMPRSAIATGLIDYVLPPNQMPEQLIKYIKHATNKTTARITPVEGPIPQALQKIFVILRARTEHDFSLYKKNTICRRIERRMNVHQIDDISDYVNYLQESDREADVLFKELLIGVTNFFRDPEAFEILQTKTLPDLLKAKPDDYAIRVWVPGCASGEEAYSIAIVLHECMEQVGRHFHIQIFGTDIDENAINVARTGLYPESILADVDSGRIKRYFDKEDGGHYRVKKLIREMLVFAPQNVIKDPPFTKLDLLCCRNLLIYLGQELQRKLLPIFHYSLKSDGILFLGSSETIGPFTDLFHLSDKKWKIFHRKTSAEAVHQVPEFPTQPNSYEARDLEVPQAVQKAEELSALQLVETILQQSETPPCAIINDACNVVYIHGRTGRYLEPAEGKASVNVVEMARPGLKMELASAIRQVTTNKQEMIHRGLEVKHNGGKIFVNLSVKPILEQISMRGLMMVVFEETATRSKKKQSTTKSVRVHRKGKSVEELEQDLQYTRENLQTTIEELETSNEELKSTNEELQSTNEELQSTNEELETSKEELQSLNEESATVNTELQARIDELSRTHDDMKNLLDSTDIATIFLDTELRIRRFTPRATDIIPLTATDHGRPIKHLATSLLDIDLVEFTSRVLADLSMQEVEVESTDGQHYVLRVRPYRTVSNVIEGVVATFENITKYKRAMVALRDSEQKLTSAQELASFGHYSLDIGTNDLTLSNTLVRILELRPEQTTIKLGEFLDLVHPDDIERITQLLQNLIKEKQEDIETVYRVMVESGEVKTIKSRAETVIDGTETPIVLFGTSQEITEHQLQEQSLLESEHRYRLLFDMVQDSVLVIEPENMSFLEFNQTAHEHLGYTREEFQALTVFDIEYEPDAEKIKARADHILSHGIKRIEARHVTKEGKILNVIYSGQSVSVGEKKLILAVVHDASLASDVPPSGQ